MNEKIAKQWFLKASQKDPNEENIDIFNKFISLWISLNALYGDTDGKNDRYKCVNYFAKHEDKILNLCNTKIFIQFVKARGGVENMDIKSNSPYKINQINESTVAELAHCLYTIRCNLFHGDKSLDNPELLEKASNLLNDFLTILINN